MGKSKVGTTKAPKAVTQGSVELLIEQAS
ncbi:uncharacterized protein G2W53_009287 [Senna tora]|uniref:Uncharacterized protein n=1 Tax=Senna tora TaxID=362788 RepID=A0A834WXJ6_9FABA|nr:uncharacterized protein G2W53_009287 [Senna tora]